MLLGNQIIIYLKTAEHCNLNCSHCFSASGRAPKQLLDMDQAESWLIKLEKLCPWIKTPQINFFGGEPMIADIKRMNQFIDNTKHLWEGNIVYTITTNLVYAMTEEKLAFLKRLNGIATSWDKGIRFATNNQFELWKKNCKILTKENNLSLALQVCLLKQTIAMDVKELYELTKEIGANDLQFEKLSLAGGLLDHVTLIPDNLDLNNWFVSMYNTYVDNEYYKHFSNAYINSILTSMLYQTFSGCRARNCETKVFTINANGSIANCPNNAIIKSSQIGTIWQEPIEILSSTNRLKSIRCEAKQDERCLECPVFMVCNGGCVRSTSEMWQKDNPLCPEAKFLMLKLKKENNRDFYKTILNGFKGSEIPGIS